MMVRLVPCGDRECRWAVIDQERDKENHKQERKKERKEEQ
jgi:hypothetical protein